MPTVPVQNIANDALNAFSSMMQMGQSHTNAMMRVHELNAQGERDKQNQIYRQKQMDLANSQESRIARKDKIAEKAMALDILQGRKDEAANAAKAQADAAQKQFDNQMTYWKTYANLAKKAGLGKEDSYLGDITQGKAGGTSLHYQLAKGVDKQTSAPGMVNNLDELMKMPQMEAFAAFKNTMQYVMPEAKTKEEQQALARLIRSTETDLLNMLGTNIKTNDSKTFIDETVKTIGGVDEIGPASPTRRIATDAEKLATRRNLEKRGSQAGIVSEVDKAYQGKPKGDPTVAADIRDEVVGNVAAHESAQKAHDKQSFGEMKARRDASISMAAHDFLYEKIMPYVIPPPLAKQPNALSTWWTNTDSLFNYDVMFSDGTKVPMRDSGLINQSTKILLHAPNTGDAFTNAKNMQEAFGDPIVRKLFACDMARALILTQGGDLDDPTRQAMLAMISQDEKSIKENGSYSTPFGHGQTPQGQIMSVSALERSISEGHPKIAMNQSPIDNEWNKGLHSTKPTDFYNSALPVIQAWGNQILPVKGKDDLGNTVSGPSMKKSSILASLKGKAGEASAVAQIDPWLGKLTQEWNYFANASYKGYSGCLATDDELCNRVAGSMADMGYHPLASQIIKGPKGGDGARVSYPDLRASLTGMDEFFTKEFQGITPKGDDGETPVASLNGYPSLIENMITEVKSNGNIGEVVGRLKGTIEEMAKKGWIVQSVAVNRRLSEAIPGWEESLGKLEDIHKIKRDAVRAKVELDQNPNVTIANTRKKIAIEGAINGSEKLAVDLLTNLEWNGKSLAYQPKERKVTPEIIRPDIEANGDNGAGIFFWNKLSELAKVEAATSFLSEPDVPDSMWEAEPYIRAASTQKRPVELEQKAQLFLRSLLELGLETKETGKEFLKKLYSNIEKTGTLGFGLGEPEEFAPIPLP